MDQFRALGIQDEILRAVGALGFEVPTPVQLQTIPAILMMPNDLVVLAQTGTGKTAAFGLPMLQKIDAARREIQLLILSPTRELCMQIGEDLRSYAQFRPDIFISTVYGGADIRRQIKEISAGVQIVVATPGRLRDLMTRGVLSLEHVMTVILDEADEMLNMGFQEELNFILDGTPKEKNVYLFSATMPAEVEHIARKYLRDPYEISIGKRNQGADTVNHQYYMVRAKDLYETLRRVIDCAPDMYALIFVRTKIDAQDVSKRLQKDGIDCDALHGDLSQAQRDNVMAAFRSKRLKVLVATDVAARGLDVDNLTHVINYNLPDDPESYTHRSGRTGRAGKEGISIAIIHSKEQGRLHRIEKMLGKKFTYHSVPNGEEICRAQLAFWADKILKADSNENLKDYEQAIFDKYADLSKEELVQHLISYQFGLLLKKYKVTEDLNVDASAEGPGPRRERDRNDREPVTYRSFVLDVGRSDGLNPRDLLDMINTSHKNIRVDVGGIQIFDTSTKFEIDSENAKNFLERFKYVIYNGIPVNVQMLPESAVVKGKAYPRGGRGGGHRDFGDGPRRSSRGGDDRGERGGEPRERRERSDRSDRGSRSRSRDDRSRSYEEPGAKRRGHPANKSFNRSSKKK